MKFRRAIICFRVAALNTGLLLTTGCSGPAGPELALKDNLSITWELTGNFFGETEHCNALFTFVNNGKSAIKGKGWTLYFNQNTLMPSVGNESTVGVVEHINGDFYRFVPGESFFISSGDTLLYNYSYQGNMIKEKDAPNGVYIACNKPGRNGIVFLPKNYTIKPFTNYENLFTGYSGHLPTPQNEYFRNSIISDLPDEKTGLIIPSPYKYSKGNGVVELTESTVIYYDKELENEAEYIVATAMEFFGAILKKTEGTGGGDNSIVLKISDISVNGIKNEAYHLSIRNGKGITITGSDPAGVFYGIQSLLALIPPADLAREVSSVKIPCAEISDAPRFHFRGFLLDVARNFQGKDAVHKLIDLLAFYKINTLNLRLTDDEGWRLEIKGLPELNLVGSRRGHTLDSKDYLPPSFGSGPFPDSAGNHGSGFYSRDDLIDIITYAGRRHVSIIPEICFPGHARAAIKSMEARYRYYMDKGDKKSAEEFRLIDPYDRSSYNSAQLYNDNIVCVGSESTYHFYETVIKELTGIYEEAGSPLKLFHTGGDEVPAGAWSESPLCRKLMEENPDIKDPGHLQAYFFKKVLVILEKYNLSAGGWEEVALNKDTKGNITINSEFTGRNVVPYVWDNTGDNIDLGYRIANAGYKVVLCNVTNLYFDLAYNADPKEPGLYWGGFQDAKDPFVLIPFDLFRSSVYDDYGNFACRQPEYGSRESLRPECIKNIIGLQAQLWSETIKGESMMEYYILPKLFAFAEKAWAVSPSWETEADLKSRIAKIDTDWNEFANRIGKHELPRLDHLYGGYNYRIPLPGAILENGILKANIAYPGLTIHYTIDGTEPGLDSPVYNGPFESSGPVRLSAFTSAGRSGRSVTVQ